MADLTDLLSSQSVKIAGASTAGTESGFVDQYNSQLKTADVINGSAVQASLSVGTTAVAARVGASDVANRKMLLIQCQSTGITYGFTVGSQPFSLPNGTTLTLAIGPNITVYVKRNIAGGTVVVAELV